MTAKQLNRSLNSLLFDGNNGSKQTQTNKNTSYLSIGSSVSTLADNCPSNATDAQNDNIKIQVYYSGFITVIYINDGYSVTRFYDIVRAICKFDMDQVFTVKWLDEEGDPCTISTQIEFEEALRLYFLNKENEIVMHVFPNMPSKPGMFLFLQ
jgi:hypothetical protein